MTASESFSSVPQRLPFRSLVSVGLDVARDFAFVLVLVFVVHAPFWLLWAAVFRGVLGLGFAIIRYYTFTVAIEDQKLVTRETVLSRSERKIPLSSIQDISYRQDLSDRFAGTVHVTIETAGAGDAEASFHGLLLSQYEALRREVLETRARGLASASSPASPPAGESPVEAAIRAALPPPATKAAEAEPETILKLGTLDLLIAGFVEGSLFVAVALGFSMWFFIEEWAPVLVSMVGPRLEGVAERAKRFDETTWAVLVPPLLVFLLTVGKVIKAVRTAWSLQGFRVRWDGARLERGFGLVERRRQVIRAGRVQSIRIEQSFVERLFHRARVTVGTAVTYRKDDHEESGAFRIPSTDLAALRGVVARLLPNSPLLDGAFERFSRRIVTRLLLSSAILSAVVSSALYAFDLRIFAALAWVIFLRDLFRALFLHRESGYRLDGDYATVKFGALGRTMTIVRLARTQVVDFEQGPIDRLLGIAGVSAHVAGGGHHLGIDPLPEGAAVALYERFAETAVAAAEGEDPQVSRVS